MCLRRLKDLGLVEVVTTQRENVSVLNRVPLNILTEAGAAAVVAYYADRDIAYIPRWQPTLKDYAARTTAHALAINDAAIALAASAQEAGYTFLDWHDDLHLRALRDDKQVLLTDFWPDGFFSLGWEHRIWPFFLEIDRGTESVGSASANSWRSKMKKYGQYLKFRWRADSYFLPEQYAHPPLVLTVTTGPTRLENLLEATQKAGGGKSYWFAAREWLGLDYDVMGPIWRAPYIDELCALREHCSS